MIRAGLLLTLLLASCGAWADEQLSIRRADGRIVDFRVEIAADDASREHGLMYRTALPAGQGMLFVYPVPAQREFWMKNTLIPLDMLFFNDAGELVYVEPSATPETLDARGPRRADICAVLEIAGGQAAASGLKPGDRMVLDDMSACLP